MDTSTADTRTPRGESGFVRLRGRFPDTKKSVAAAAVDRIVAEPPQTLVVAAFQSSI